MRLPDMSAPEATVRVCVDTTAQAGMGGFFCGERLLQPVHFTDAHDFLLQLDGMMDMQNAPQAFQQGRTFARRNWIVPAACGEAAGMAPGQVTKARGKCLTATVALLSRRNATWQGTVDFLDGQGPVEFASALALLLALSARLAPQEMPLP